MPAVIDLAYPRRVRQSPELAWRYLRRLGTQLTAENAERVCRSNVREDTSDKTQRIMRTLPSLMRARIDLLLSPGFQPSQWPGLKALVEPIDQGWVAWEIVGDVLTVLDATRCLRPSDIPKVQSVYGAVVLRAAEYVRRRLTSSGLSMDEKVIVEDSLRSALQTPFDARMSPHERGFYIGRDVTEFHRAQVNDLLSVETAWDLEPATPSLGMQMLTQLRAKGYRKQTIRDELRKVGYDANSAEACALTAMNELPEEEWNPQERQQAVTQDAVRRVLNAAVSEANPNTGAPPSTDPRSAAARASAVSTKRQGERPTGNAQANADEKIRKFKSDYSRVYADLVKRHEHGDSTVLAEARRLFGRNSLAKKLKISGPFVSKSTAWKAMAAELGLKGKRRLTRSKKALDAAVEVVSTKQDDKAVNQAALAELRHSIKGLPAKERQAIESALREGAMPLEKIREVTEVALSQYADAKGGTRRKPSRK